MGNISLVTGAGGYIGGGVAKALAKRGDFVYVCDINGETAGRVSSEIEQAGGMAKGIVMDVTDSANVDAVFNNIISEKGRIDVVVHAAGGSAKIASKNAKYCDLADQEDYVIDRVFKVNLYGAMYIGRAAARVMRIQKSGHIVIISSAIGLNGYKGKTEYAAAKGGVIAMAKSLAKEMGEYGVTVNTVAPGSVGNTWVKDEDLVEFGFLNIRGNAEDVANAVDFATSSNARFITGQTIVVDGGRSLALKGTD